MIWDISGTLFGVFLAAALIFNVIRLLLNTVTRYRMAPRRNIVISFLISLLVFIILSEAIHGNGMLLTGHISALVILFLYDFIKTNYQKCPHCAERIKADAFKCKHCHSDIREIG